MLYIGGSVVCTFIVQCISTSAELFQVNDETIIHKRVRASSLERGQRKQKQTVYNFEKCKSILESINQFCSKWLTFVLVCYISITGILVIEHISTTTLVGFGPFTVWLLWEEVIGWVLLYCSGQPNQIMRQKSIVSPTCITSRRSVRSICKESMHPSIRVKS